MSESFLQIDISNLYDEQEDNDLIEIKLKNEEIVQIHFSKLVKESKYIRDKYKYSEFRTFIKDEINEVEERMKIDDCIIKNFIQLLQNEKVEIPIKYFKYFYTLSEYFNIPKILRVLDKLSEKNYFKILIL